MANILRIEGEDLTIVQGGGPASVVASNHAGFLGTGFLDPNGASGVKATLEFGTPDLAATETSTCSVSLRVANGDGNDPRPIALNLDDGGATPATDPQEADTQPREWSNWETRTFELSVTGPGPHIVEILQSGSGAPNIDAVVVHTLGSVPDFDPLEFSSPDAFTVGEGNVAVGSILAEDLDEGALTYGLGAGGDEGLFDIDPGTGALSFKEAPADDVAPASYTVNVTATKGSDTITQGVSVSVVNVPQIDQVLLQGEDAVVSGDSFARTQEAARADATDGDGEFDIAEGVANGNKGEGQPLDEHGLREGYSGTGYLDLASGADESMTWTANVAEAGPYDLHVRYANGSQDRPLDIAVGAAVQHAAQSFAGTGFGDWLVKTFTVELGAGDNELSLAIAGDTGGPNIDAVALTSLGTEPSFPPANTAPVLDAPPTSVDAAENQTAVTTLAITDDGQDEVTFALSGDDEALFDVSGAGEVTFKQAPDFENPAGVDNTYQVTITATDEAGSATHDLTVNVTDDASDNGTPNEAPTVQGGQAQTAEGTLVAIDVSDLIEDDTDADADLDVAAFVDPAQGTVSVSGTIISFTPAVGFTGEAQIIYTASDLEGVVSAEATVAVDVSEVDEPATAITLTAVDPAPAENLAGAVLATIAITGPDTPYGPDDLALSDATNFQVVGTPGALQLALADGISLDAEAAPQLSVTVSVGDATSAAFIPAPGDVNEAPTLTGGVDAATVTTEGGTVSLQGLTVADPDDGDAPTLGVRLAGGGDLPDGVEIDADGDLVIPGSLEAGDLALEIFASDGSLESNSVSLLVTVEEAGDVTVDPVTIQAEDGTQVTVIDVGDPGTGPVGRAVTQVVGPGETDAFGNDRENAVGDAFVDFGEDPGDAVVVAYDAPVAGAYTFTISYAMGSSQARVLALSVNGATSENVAFGDSGGWDTYADEEVEVSLVAGVNVVTLEIPTAADGGTGNGPNIDQVTFALMEADPGDVDSSADADETPLSLAGPIDDVAFASKAAIAFNVAGRDADIVKVEVSFDGGVTRTEVTDEVADNGDITVDGSALAAGDVTATVYVTDASDNEASTTYEFTIAPEVAGNAAPTVANTTADAVEDTAIVIDVADSVSDDTTADADLTITAEATNGTVTAVNGAEIAFTPDVDFAGQATITYRAQDLDGATSADATITVDVAAQDDAPSAVTLTAIDPQPAENVAGADVATVVVADVDTTYALADLTLNDPSGQFELAETGTANTFTLKLGEGEALDADAAAQPSVTVTAGGVTSEVFEPAPLNDTSDDGGPVEVDFSAAAISSYTTSQDLAGQANVLEGGSALQLAGNLWKRVSLPSDYDITANTRLEVTLEQGAVASEIVAIGFDLDENFTDGNESVYKLGGTQNFNPFPSVAGTDNGDGTTSFVIDLSAHDGTTINSLVFVADDDNASNGTGSPIFSGVRLVEDDPVAGGNEAPTVVGGGVADLSIDEGGSVEIDLPFVDADGPNPLSFDFAIADGDGTDITDGFGLSLSQGVLSGTLGDGVAPGVYTVTVTADDGEATTDDVFTLTVENVNEAPEVLSAAAPEPFFGAVGQAIEPIAVADFLGFFSDPDGDDLTLSIEGLPAGLTVEEGVIFGTPTEAGDGSFTVVASDGDGPDALTVELEIGLLLDAPQAGETTFIEAEGFTGLGSATNFYVTGQPGASGDQLIRVNPNQPGAVTTDLGGKGVLPGWHTVSIDLYDELDGSATFSLSVGDTVLATDLSFDSEGEFLNPGADRGNAGQSGNLKRITLDTPVLIEAGDPLTLTGQADGELLRIDRVGLTRTDEPDQAPTAPTLDAASVDENAAGAVVGAVSSTDPDGDDAAIAYTVDDDRFEVVAGQLRLVDGVSLDFETEPSVAVTVTATDESGATAEAEFTITVNDVDEEPGAVSISDAAVDENAEGVVIGTLSADDGDGGAVVSFTTTDPRFTVVNGNELALATGVALDHEADESVTVDVLADGAAAPTTLTISVNDLDEAPTLIGTVDAAAVPAEGGSVDLSGLTAEDEDENQTATLGVLLANGDPAPDGVVIENGALTVPSGLDGTLELAIFAESGGLTSDPVPLTVTIGEPAPFETVILQAEDFTVLNAPGDTNPNLIRTETQNWERDGSPDNPEPNDTDDNPGAPEFNELGLRPDYSGTGYLDPQGNDTGAQTEIAFQVPADTYKVTVRLANGADQDRPITLDFGGGVTATIADTRTGEFYLWETRTVTVTLPGGPGTLTILQDATQGGPNIDAVAIHEPGVVPVFVVPPADESADEDGNLVAAAVLADVVFDDRDAVAFDLTGVDADIQTIEVSVDGGDFVPATVTGTGENRVATVDLSAFAAGDDVEVAFRLTDDDANEIETTASVSIEAGDVTVDPVTIQAEDGTQVTVIDVGDPGTGPVGRAVTQVVGPGETDAFGNDRENAVGDAFVDFGEDPGDAVVVVYDAPVAGTYTFTVDYANGSSDARVLALSVNGFAQGNVSFSNSGGWDTYTGLAVDVELDAGPNTIRLEIPSAAAGGTGNGPNIDQFTLALKDDDTGGNTGDPEPGPRETIAINFQDGTTPKAQGYLVDNFEGFGDRGNGETYGWITEASAVDADGTTNTPIDGGAYPAIAINERTGGAQADYDARLQGYAHFDLGGYPTRTGWELELENGWYEVTVSVGDTGGPNDSDNQLLVEGEPATAWVPTDDFKSQLITVLADVQDGHLTLAAPDGTITEMQYLEVRALPDLTPGDGNPAPVDYAAVENPVALPQGGTPQPIGFGDGLRPDDIDPTASFAFDVAVAGNRGGVLETSLNDQTVRLYETLTGEVVDVALNTTGGFDAVVINPQGDLKENTSYTIVVDGLFDRGPNEGSGGPREFQKYSTSFTTGEAPEVVDRDVAFADQVMATEGGFASLTFSPDGTQLYVSTLYGAIIRWDLDPATGEIVASSREAYAPAALQGEAIIGLAFDPNDPDRIWITANDGGLSDAADFTGQVWTVDLDPAADAFDATATLRIEGLPRSERDHLSNSLAFRENPAAGQDGEPSHLLYLIQGSNSAMGAPDSAWGWRAERALAAAVLEIDPDAVTQGGPLDVQTEQDWAATTNNTSLDPLNDPNNPNEYIDAGDGNLAVAGFYNPFADDAPVRVFASGQRNAYDLVWHSNGLLYVPTNGSAGGGRAPDDPSTNDFEGITGIPTRNDYLFAVEKGGYYGHPNPIRGEFILNGGNPTSGGDPAEVGTYDVGTGPDPNYRGFAFDFGRNVSPNGAAEYTADVFGSNLKGAVIVTQYSNPDTLIALTPGPDGTITASQVIQREDGSTIEYSDPLDVIVNPVTGQMYMVTFERNSDFGVSSKLVLLNPVAGDVMGDNTADEGDDLEIVVIDATDPQNVVFEVRGLDADIQAIEVSFNQGAPQDVTLDGQGRFVRDLSAFDGQVTATLTVADDDDNTSSDGVSFTPGTTPTPSGLIDALEFNNLDVGDTVVRDVDDPTTHENNSNNDGNGDGLNDGFDGDGYVDFGGPAGDKVSFAVTAATAGVYTLTLRMANGASANRPIELKLGGQVATIADTKTGSFGTWQDFDVQLNLAQGTNTIVVEQTTDDGGPNIDSVTVTLDTPTDGTADEGGDLALTLVDASNPVAVLFAVTGDDDDIEAYSASVNGGTAEPVTPNQQGEFTLDLSALSGTVSVALSVADEVPNTASTSAVVDLGGGVPNDGTETVSGKAFVIYEAENAALTGTTDEVTTAEDDRGQSGGAFVDFDGAGEVSITWTVEVPEDGPYQVDFLYALATGKAPRPMDLSVDGGAAQTVPFPANSDQAETDWGPSTVQLDLTAGTHTLELSASGAASPNLDYVRVSAQPLDGPLDQSADEGAPLTLTVLDQSDPEAVLFEITGLDDDIETATIAFNGGDPIDVSAANGQFTADVGAAFGQIDAVLVVNDDDGNTADTTAQFSVAPDGNPNADIAVQSGDPMFYDDRLHFSFLQDDSASNPDRSFKDSATVTITNTGTEGLEVSAAEVTGPFDLADPTVFDGLTLGAGASIDVEILFDATEIAPKPGNGQNGVQEGALTLTTNDAEDPIVSVDLAGFWQARDEGGWEPNINEVWQVFGFGNEITGLALNGGGENSVLNFFDVYLPVETKYDSEVLSPYWRIADGVQEAKITQIAAFHGDGGASMGIHGPGDKSGSNDIGFGSHAGNHNQRILPLEGNGSFFTEAFDRGDIPDAWAGDDVFGIEVAGLSTDPTLNPTGSGSPSTAQLEAKYPGQGYTGSDGTVFDAQGNEVPDGYTVRMYQAFDAQGEAIENVFLGVMDYTGINYDYNDNMFVVEGVTPVGGGGSLAVSGLDDSAADDRLVFTNIDNPDDSGGVGGQEFRQQAEVTLTNDGIGVLTVTGLTISGADAGDFQVSSLPGPIAPGASATVTVAFVGSDSADDNAAELREATLTVESDAFGPDPVISLAGLAQFQSEGGEEPTVAQIVEAFGYATDVAQGQLNGGGDVEVVGDEVLLPYLQRLDASQPVEIVNLAAFLQQTDISRLNLHELSDDGLTELFAGDDQQGQTVLPDGLLVGDGDTGSVGRASIDRDEPFGLKVTVDGRPTFAAWTDPAANVADPELGVNDEGHYIRFFQAKTADGEDIEGAYIGIQDYPGGGNFDYNDAMFLVRNVQPHTLTIAEDADQSGVNDALETDSDNDGLVDFFDEDQGGGSDQQAPLGGTAPTLDGLLTVGADAFDTGGQGVAWNDDPGKNGGDATRSDSDVEVIGGDIAFVEPGEWVEYTVNVAQAGSYAFSAVAKSPTDGATIALSVEDGPVLATLTVPDSNGASNGFGGTSFGPTPAETVALEAGVQTLRLSFGGTTASNGYLLDLASFTLEAQETNQDPVTTGIAGAPEAEEGAAYAFDVSGFFSDPDADDTLTFDADGLPVGLSISSSGAISGTPTADGTFAVTVTASDGQASVDSTFSLVVGDGDEPAGQQPFGGTAPGFAGGTLTLDAAEYDEGGQGVAYNDAAGLQGGSNGGRAGSDVEITGLGDIGWIGDGEWVEYTVNVAQSGAYDLDMLLALGGGTGRTATVDFYAAGASAPYSSTGAIANPSTGGWTTFAERSFDGLALQAGEQVVRVTFEGGSQDFRSLTLTQQEVDENQAPTASAIADAAVQEGGEISVDVSGAFSDADGDDLTYTVGGLAGLTISDAGVISGTAPEVGADTEFSVTVTASDGELSAPSTFTLTVEDEPVAGPVQTPVPGPGAPVLGTTLTVDATNFDAGGQGVSWNDDPGLDGGSGDGRPDADVELVGSELDIGYVEQGEWVEYTIDVAAAGAYNLSVIAKSPVAGNGMAVSIEDGPTLATIGLPDSNGGSTGFGGTTFAPTAPVEIDLAAGEQTLRFTFEGAPAANQYLLDMRSFTLDEVEDDGSGDSGGAVVGQAGSVTFEQGSSDQWFSVEFDEALVNPSVVMGPISLNGEQQANMRVRDVTDTGFEFQLDEWDYLDGGHTTETVSWLAIEDGTHQIGGLTVVAGQGSASEAGTSIAFGENFGSAPVVMAQVVTTNDPDAVTDRIDAVTATGFDVALDDEEANSSDHGSESLAWIAVEQGSAAGGGLWAATTGNAVTHDMFTQSFDDAFADDFAFLADMQTEDGGDPAVVRLSSLTDSEATFFIEEEQSDDTEVNHTTEVVGSLGIATGLVFQDDTIA